MIWSLAEIWVPLAVAFLLGCVVGSLIFQRLSIGRLAGRQASIHRRIEGSLPQLGRRSQRGERPAPVTAPAVAEMPAPSRKAAAPVETVAPVAPAAPVAASSPPPASAPAAERPVPARRASRAVELPVVTVPSPEEIAAGRPPALEAPRGGRPDNLRKIKGIGESFEARLHALGIFHFDQIAEWSLKQAAWVAMETGAADRVIRNDWVGQAKALAEELRGGGGEA